MIFELKMTWERRRKLRDTRFIVERRGLAAGLTFRFLWFNIRCFLGYMG